MIEFINRMGITYFEIADNVGISEQSVKNYLENICPLIDEKEKLLADFLAWCSKYCPPVFGFQSESDLKKITDFAQANGIEFWSMSPMDFKIPKAIDEVMMLRKFKSEAQA